MNGQGKGPKSQRSPGFLEEKHRASARVSESRTKDLLCSDDAGKGEVACDCFK